MNLLSESYVKASTKDHVTDIFGMYSYGYQWYLTMVGTHPPFLANGYGGQIMGVVPSSDLVVVLKYEAENPVHPVSGTGHDDLYLFELVVNPVVGFKSRSTMYIALKKKTGETPGYFRTI